MVLYYYNIARWWYKVEVKCAKCGKEVVINGPNAEAYIQLKDGSIIHAECPKEGEESGK